MNSTVTITMDSKRKEQAERLFDELGLDMNSAVNVFIAKCLEWNGIPFSIEHRYNAETEAAFQETEDMIAGKIPSKSYHSLQELLDELDAEEDEE